MQDVVGLRVVDIQGLGLGFRGLGFKGLVRV